MGSSVLVPGVEREAPDERVLEREFSLMILKVEEKQRWFGCCFDLP